MLKVYQPFKTKRFFLRSSRMNIPAQPNVAKGNYRYGHWVVVKPLILVTFILLCTVQRRGQYDISLSLMPH